MTPYYMEPNGEDWMRKRMDTYGAICSELAEKYGCRFIDLQAVFNDYFQYRHSSYIAWDRIHPNQIGATVIARAFLENVDLIIITDRERNKKTGESVLLLFCLKTADTVEKKRKRTVKFCLNDQI